MKGYVPNDEIFAEVRSALETKSEAAYKRDDSDGGEAF